MLGVGFCQVFFVGLVVCGYGFVFFFILVRF